MMMTSTPADRPLDAELRWLHDAYLQKVNAAVAAGREDLVNSLTQEFPDDALDLLLPRQSA
jgi:hypothetical protein